MNKYLFFALAATQFHATAFAQGWQSISSFGSNPGNLNAYSYAPAVMPDEAPLVVVMHGCTQTATSYSNETAWNTLADFHKFYVVYAEQKTANNASSCFNYWEPGDHSRGQGEAKSIKQMVEYMKNNYSIDSSRVFATGLSAGGAMTAVMLSAYPEVFAAGAEMAGLPYKVATTSLEVYTAALGLVSKSPQEWGDLVRGEYPGFTGSYPRLAIFHGTSDIVINENNAEEMMKQFTNLHGCDQTADYDNSSFNGNSVVGLKQYFNTGGQIVVERYTISNMAHGIAVDPGSCFEQGGDADGTAFDVDFYSSYWAAKFFGILQPPFVINGADTVNINQQGVGYSVLGNPGSAYDWQVTGGAIASGQGTNSITVDWNQTSGTVSLTETMSGGCTLGPVELPVSASNTTGVENANTGGEEILLNLNGKEIQYLIKSGVSENARVFIVTLSGQVIYEENASTNKYHSLKHDLLAGMYVLKCLTRKNQMVRKLIAG